MDAGPKFAAYPRDYGPKPSENLAALFRGYCDLELSFYAWLLALLFEIGSEVYSMSWIRPVPMFGAVACGAASLFFGIRGSISAGSAFGWHRAASVVYGLLALSIGFFGILILYSSVGRAMKTYGIKQRFSGGIDRKQVRHRIEQLMAEECSLVLKSM